MKFSQIKAMVLAFLGTSLEVKEGKEILSADNRKALETVYGKTFLEKFEADLAKDQAEEEVTSEDVQAMVAAITAHNSAVQAEAIRLNKELTKKINAQATELANAQMQITKLSADPEEEIVASIDESIPRAENRKTLLKVNLNSPIYAPVIAFLKTGTMTTIQSAVQAETIDVVDLKQEFGTFLSQNQNNLEMVKTLFTGFSSAQYFTTAMGTTEWRATQALITSVMQQFSSTWTASGNAKIRPLRIQNRHHKINFPIKPADVLETYAMHLYDEGLAPDQMPITLYIWNELIYPQLMQDIELRAIFKGKFVEQEDPENPVATSPEDSMDGLETILVEGKANGVKFNIYTPGNTFNILDPENSDQEVVDFVHGFVDFIAPNFKRKKMAIACSEEAYKRYKRAYKKINSIGSDKADNPDYGQDRIDYSQQYLVPMEGMYGSPILFVTTKENMKLLRHKNEVPRVIRDVQKADYVVKLFGEFWMAPGFAFAEAVFAAIPDDYDPQAELIRVMGAHTEYQQFQVADAGSEGGGL
ncbi:hypothetical protein [Roseivirga seohaensis]|uniref:hypothetical protein n=1 Tax=Roseivirga seohaensis TaxID=1914963 RepID=UPI003BAA8091